MGRAIRWVIGIVVLVGIVVGIAVQFPAVQDALIRRVIAERIKMPHGDLLKDDALRMVLCGTASPMPHPTRAKACVAVFAAGHFWIVDTGPGSWNRIALLQIDGRD